MTKVFGLPILSAIVLGIVFPYQARQLTTFGFVFLFLLMIWAGLTIRWSLLRKIKDRWFEVSISMLLLFAVIPLVQRILVGFFTDDHQYLYGATLAALCPSAIVAPFFVKLVDGDEELSFIVMTLSTVLCPLIIPLALHFSSTSLAVNTLPLFLNIALFVSVPLAFSFFLQRKFQSVADKIQPHLATLNVLCLAALIYILFGTVVSRVNTAYIPQETLWQLTLTGFFQDFGILLILRFALRPFLEKSVANTICITVAMKNVAISAGLLLFYDPKAALPSILIFIAHAALFNFIPWSKRLWR